MVGHSPVRAIGRTTIGRGVACVCATAVAFGVALPTGTADQRSADDAGDRPGLTADAPPGVVVEIELDPEFAHRRSLEGRIAAKAEIYRRLWRELDATPPPYSPWDPRILRLPEGVGLEDLGTVPLAPESFPPATISTAVVEVLRADEPIVLRVVATGFRSLGARRVLRVLAVHLGTTPSEGRSLAAVASEGLMTGGGGSFGFAPVYGESFFTIEPVYRHGEVDLTLVIEESWIACQEGLDSEQCWMTLLAGPADLTCEAHDRLHAALRFAERRVWDVDRHRETIPWSSGTTFHEMPDCSTAVRRHLHVVHTTVQVLPAPERGLAHPRLFGGGDNFRVLEARVDARRSRSGPQTMVELEVTGPFEEPVAYRASLFGRHGTRTFGIALEPLLLEVDQHAGEVPRRLVLSARRPVPDGAEGLHVVLEPCWATALEHRPDWPRIWAQPLRVDHVPLRREAP